MTMKKLVRSAIKWAPIIYPIAKKMANKRKSKSAKTTYTKA